MRLGSAVRMGPTTKKCRAGDVKPCHVVIWGNDAITVVKHVEDNGVKLVRGTSWLKQEPVTLPADEMVEIPSTLNLCYGLVYENLSEGTTVRRVE